MRVSGQPAASTQAPNEGHKLPDLCQGEAISFLSQSPTAHVVCRGLGVSQASNEVDKLPQIPDLRQGQAISFSLFAQHRRVHNPQLPTW